MSAESFEERETRLHPRRAQSRLRKGRPGYIRGVSNWPPSLLRKGRPGYIRGMSDWPPSLLRKGRPGYCRGVSDWPLSLLRKGRPGYVQSRRERLAATTSTVQRCTLQPTTWTLAPYHLSYRLVLIHVHVLTACTRLSLEMLIAIMLMIQFGPCRYYLRWKRCYFLVCYPSYHCIVYHTDNMPTVDM